MAYRIGFVGNSCTGKTTATFAVINELKMRRCLVGYAVDACRFVTFPPERFDDNAYSRAHVLFQHLANETEQLVRTDLDYLVMERTAFDWWLYYRWTRSVTLDHSRGGLDHVDDEVIENLVAAWMRSFDLVFFMESEGMVYVEDGFRPASTQRRERMERLYQQGKARLAAQCRAMRTIGGTSLEERNERVLWNLRRWLADGNLIVRDTRLRAYTPLA